MKISWATQEFKWGTDFAIRGIATVNGKKLKHAMRFQKPESEVTPEDIKLAKKMIKEYFKEQS